MSRMRNEAGIALVTTIVLMAVMLVLGSALLTIVDTQSDQTVKERTGDAAFNLAESALNAEAFLLGRNWPQTLPAPAPPATPPGVVGQCGTHMRGTLATPAATVSVTDQIQNILARAHAGSGSPTTSQWWVTACDNSAGTSAWDANVLTRLPYDTTTSAGTRRLWVRAEAKLNGRRRAVVGLVQAGQQPVFPSNYSVVTGKFGADLGVALNAALTGGVVSSLLSTDPMFSGGRVGLRCSLLSATTCVSNLFTTTTALGLGTLLTANNWVHFASDTIIDVDQLAQLRQQAQATGTYRAAGTVAAGANCLPAGSNAGKIVFIEQVGTGTSSCILNTPSSAKAVIVGSGGVTVRGGGTFTGVIYALHRTALASNAADVRIEGGSKVRGGVYVDDNPALGANAQGQVLVASNLCGLLGAFLCSLLNVLGLSTLLGALDSSFPAVIHDQSVINAVTTFSDSALVPGTFRAVPPMF